MLKTKIKTYRIGLYGLSGAGKTCILTALAMPKTSNRDGLSATLIPGTQNKDYIVQAQQRLEQGEVPAPTALHERVVYEYDFTHPDRRSFRVQIHDYSGELIDPDTNSQQVAKKLLQHFEEEEIDAIVVLAEVEHAEEHNRSYQQLNKITQAFAALKKNIQKKSTLDVPIALLITKWDRYRQIDAQQPEQEAAALDEFLASDCPHQQLANALRNSVAEADFQSFAVSAFGQHERVQVEEVQIERPLSVTPLPSFNLVEAFSWLTQRRDELDLQLYQQHGLCCLWTCAPGKDLLIRYPENSAIHQDLKRRLRGCYWCRGLGLLIQGLAVLALVLAVLAVERYLDQQNYQKHKANIESASSNAEKLNAAETWLQNYAQANGYRHLLLRLKFTREDAQAALKALQLKREQMLWGLVEKAETLATKHSLAKKYLAQYANGGHAQAAQELILKAEREQQVQTNEKALNELRHKYKQLNLQDLNKAEDNHQALQNLLQALQNFPPPHDEAEVEQRKKFTAKVQLEQTKLTAKLDEQRFIEDVLIALESESFLEAARLVEQRQPRSAKIEELVEEFKKQVHERLQIAVEKAIADNNFYRAEQLLGEYFHPSFSPSLQLRTGRSVLEQLRNKLKLARDRQAYALVQQQRTQDAIRRYLADSQSPQIMKAEVLAYQQYLSQVQGEQPLSGLRLKLNRIEWHDWSYRENWLKIDINHQAAPIFYNHIGRSKENETRRSVERSNPFNLAANSVITIKIGIDGKRRWDWKLFDNHCQGSVARNLQDLQKDGVAIELFELDKPSRSVATIHLNLEGYPNAPVLPAFRER